MWMPPIWLDIGLTLGFGALARRATTKLGMSMMKRKAEEYGQRGGMAAMGAAGKKLGRDIGEARISRHIASDPRLNPANFADKWFKPFNRPTQSGVDSIFKTMKAGGTSGSAALDHLANKSLMYTGLGYMTGMLPMLAIGSELAGGIPQMFAPVREELMLAQTQQYIMPRRAFTQRQRALQAIHMSRLQTRSALGNEATFLHQ